MFQVSLFGIRAELFSYLGRFVVRGLPVSDAQIDVVLPGATNFIQPGFVTK